MGEVTSSPSSRRRWWRSRKLIYLLVLIIGCTIANFAWDALFMPADLRQLQGRWQLVRLIQGGAEPHAGGIAIVGRRISRFDRDGVVERAASFEIDPERHEILIFEDRDFQFLGATVRVPLWLRQRAEHSERFRYEWIDEKLRISRLSEGDPVAIAEFVREPR